LRKCSRLPFNTPTAYSTSTPLGKLRMLGSIPSASASFARLVLDFVENQDANRLRRRQEVNAQESARMTPTHPRRKTTSWLARRGSQSLLSHPTPFQFATRIGGMRATEGPVGVWIFEGRTADGHERGGWVTGREVAKLSQQYPRASPSIRLGEANWRGPCLLRTGLGGIRAGLVQFFFHARSKSGTLS